MCLSRDPFKSPVLLVLKSRSVTKRGRGSGDVNDGGRSWYCFRLDEKVARDFRQFRKLTYAIKYVYPMTREGGMLVLLIAI